MASFADATIIIRSNGTNWGNEMLDLKRTLNRLASGERFSREEARTIFDYMISGEATGPQIGALLMGLRLRGETIEEIVGAVQAMRPKMIRVDAPAGAVDIVGTGGDGVGTFNISTTAAFIVAGADVRVAKHGNRAVSSKSGAADVLVALGVAIDQTPIGVSRCILEAGLGFMFAPAHHPALKAVMPARIELAMPTIFNLLGPLVNPAGVTRHLVGVYSIDWLVPMAEALRDLGSERCLVVHGDDGLDEITLTGPTQVAMLAGGEIRRFEISPEDVGLSRARLADLKGSDNEHNAAALREVLGGKPGAYRDVALFNAAAALIASGVAQDWEEAMTTARSSLDEGRALACLERLVRVSNGYPTADNEVGQR